MTGKTRFQRANYLVRDIDRALTLYVDVLGFSVTFIKDLTSDSYSYDVFNIEKKANIRMAALALEGQPNVMALTEVKNINLADMSGPRGAAIVLECQDFHAVIEAAKQLGLTVYSENKLKTVDGRSGLEQGMLDFDGNLIVLYKILSAPDTSSSDSASGSS